MTTGSEEATRTTHEEQILVRITGQDRPGLTASIMAILAKYDAQILDIGQAGTQPDFFAYPGEGHNMRGHASVHLHERITQYFEDYLK